MGRRCVDEKNIRKSLNVSKLMYHFILPAKYRRVVIDENVDQVLKEICLEISRRYPIYFLERGAERWCFGVEVTNLQCFELDNVHMFLKYKKIIRSEF